MTATREDSRGEALGLPGVVLQGLTVYRCRCGAHVPEIPEVDALRAGVAMALARKAPRLMPDERHYLRQWLGLSCEDLATLCDVPVETVRGWEAGTHSMGLAVERLLRWVVVTAPLQPLPALRTMGSQPAQPWSMTWTLHERPRHARRPEVVELAREVLGLTPEESDRVRRVAALVRATADDWVAFATATQQAALADYERGDLSLERLLDLVDRASVGAPPDYRLKLLGMTVRQARRRRPPRRPRRRPQYPPSVKRAAVEMVRLLAAHHPGLPLTPSPYHPEESSDLLDTACAILAGTGICAVTPRTLDTWRRQQDASLGQRAPRGRPLRPRPTSPTDA